MNKISLSEKKKHKKFFKDYTRAVLETLKTVLDSDVCKDFEFFIDNADVIDDALQYMQEDSLAYKYVIKLKGATLPIILLVGRDLIFSLSDIMIGGDGKTRYTGSLSEVQINAAGALISQVMTNVQEVFKDIYDTNMSIDKNSDNIALDMAEYKKELESNLYNFYFNYDLNINRAAHYKVNVLTNLEAAREVLSELKIYNAAENIISEAVLKNIKIIKDVNIEITAILGDTKVSLRDLLRYEDGSIAELNCTDANDVRIFANEVEIAKAKIVALDGHWGVQITKIIESAKRSL